MTRGGVVGPAPREVPAPAAAAVPAAAAAAAPPPAARTDPERLLFRGDAAAVLVQHLYWAGHAHVYLPAFHARVLTGHPRKPALYALASATYALSAALVASVGVAAACRPALWRRWRLAVLTGVEVVVGTLVLGTKVRDDWPVSYSDAR